MQYSYESSSYAAANDGDYMAVSGEIVQFDEGDVTQTHTIVINNDFECDNNTNKSFFSLITLEGGIPVINVTVSQTTVFIDEAECGKRPGCSCVLCLCFNLIDVMTHSLSDFELETGPERMVQMKSHCLVNDVACFA